MNFRRLGLLVLALVATGVALGSTRSDADQPVGHAVEVEQVNPGPGYAEHPLVIWDAGVKPLVYPAVANNAPLADSLNPNTYTKFLGLSGDGKGQTIAIVDAFDDPTVVADLDLFDATFHLEGRCGAPLVPGIDRGGSQRGGPVGTPCFSFSEIFSNGSRPAYDSGWAIEVAMDVEWAHAVAPQASIVLLEAQSNSFVDLLHAVDVATSMGVSVISDSWGSPEAAPETVLDHHFGTVLNVAATGDHGNAIPIYPSFSPNVMAAGGTKLSLSQNGQRLSETAWTGSGGGLSQFEPKPAFQNAVNPYSKRGIPDVSTEADPSTGAAVYLSADGLGWQQIGGTSLAAPVWAGIVAVVDQESRVPLTPANFGSRVYGNAGHLFDVTVGSNGACGAVCNAGLGYDFVTGVGAANTGIDRFLLVPLVSIPFLRLP